MPSEQIREIRLIGFKSALGLAVAEPSGHRCLERRREPGRLGRIERGADPLGESRRLPTPHVTNRHHPNVKQNASTPGSRNSISNCRSTMGFGCRIS